MAESVNNTTNARRMADGLYETRQNYRMLIHDGVMYVPAELLDIAAVLSRVRLLRWVEDYDGAISVFIRAAEAVEIAPEMGEMMNLIGKKYGCSL
jgi:hypothetical protein